MRLSVELSKVVRRYRTDLEVETEQTRIEGRRERLFGEIRGAIQKKVSVLWYENRYIINPDDYFQEKY